MPSFEVFRSFVHGHNDRAYILNVVARRAASGKYTHKLGIIEYGLQMSADCLVMRKRHQVFLPLEAWPKLMALSDTVAIFAKDNQRVHLVGKRSAPTQTNKVPKSNVAEHATKKVHLAATSGVAEPPKLPQTLEETAHQPESKPQSIEVSTPLPLVVCRKRGRPPKHPAGSIRKHVKKIKFADAQAILDTDASKADNPLPAPMRLASSEFRFLNN
jgi:hypothetical protein